MHEWTEQSHLNHYQRLKKLNRIFIKGAKLFSSLQYITLIICSCKVCVQKVLKVQYILTFSRDFKQSKKFLFLNPFLPNNFLSKTQLKTVKRKGLLFSAIMGTGTICPCLEPKPKGKVIPPHIDPGKISTNFGLEMVLPGNFKLICLAWNF